MGGLVSFVWIVCKWYFICVGLRGKLLRSVVGAVAVCTPVLPHKGASLVKIPAPKAVVVFWVWKRRFADVRAGTQAPPLRFRLDGLRVNGYFVWMDYA